VSTSTQAAAESGGPTQRKRSEHLAAWLSLTATLIAVFMQLLDVSIVNVALPSISTDLGASFSRCSWSSPPTPWPSPAR